MTLAPEAPPLRVDTLADAVVELRARGMRISTARRLVLEGLFAAPGPVSAARLAERVELDAASVYRNLELLERHGLVRHVHLGHGPGLYVLVSRHELEYLYCDRCERVTPVSQEELAPLRRDLLDRFGYKVRFTHFALVGLCEGCAAETGEAAGASGRSERAHMHSHGDHAHAHPHTHGEPHEH
jgi:Fur family ferric uptake transcriptional regulator